MPRRLVDRAPRSEKMKKSTLTLGIALFTAISVVAESSTSPEEDIQILQEEIHRQELILAALKEKLTKLEEEVVTDRIKIEIEETGFKYEGSPVSAKELENRIAMIPTDGSITIIAARMVPLKKVTAVFDLLRENGLSDISITSSKSEPDEGDNSE